MSEFSQFRFDAGSHVTRSTGGNAIASAAYRAGECLFDEREHAYADYSPRKGSVVATGIVMPSSGGPNWSREALWNAAEAAERRVDSRVARKVEMALPAAFSPEQRYELVQAWARELSDSQTVAVDWAIHAPGKRGSADNHHVHFLLTTREVGPDGLGKKAALEMANKQRLPLGLPSTARAIRELRDRMTGILDEVAERHGVDLYADARSYADRGLDLIPTRHVGVASTNMSRDGNLTERVEDHRAVRELRAQQIEARPELILEKLTVRKATFSRRDMARELHQVVDDPTRFAAVLARLEASPELVSLSRPGSESRAEVALTTQTMLDTEDGMIRNAGFLAREKTHQVAPEHVAAALARHGHLSAEQVSAVRHMLGLERLAVVMGWAGVGKSSSLVPVREAFEAARYRVFGTALSGKAVDELTTSSGIEARTLASWDYRWRAGLDTLTARDVLVVDEAGMVGSRQLAEVLERARVAGAKVILVGDHQQLQPIESGAGFRAIVQTVGAAEIRTIRRQQEAWAREASQAFARGDIETGLSAYADRGHVQRTETRVEANNAAARDYLADDARLGGSSLILAHANQDVHEQNNAVRAGRQAKGELQGEAAFTTERGVRQFAAGDRVAFLANDSVTGVKNGSLGTVEAAAEGQLRVRLDRKPAGKAQVIEFNQDAYNTIDYGYAVTIHKTQAATVDRTYVLGSGGMDAHLTYVAMTRHRDTATLYAATDDFRDYDDVVKKLGRARPATTTLDFAQRRGIETRLASIEDAKATLVRGPEHLAEIGRWREYLTAIGQRIEVAVQVAKEAAAALAHQTASLAHKAAVGAWRASQGAEKAAQEAAEGVRMAQVQTERLKQHQGVAVVRHFEWKTPANWDRLMTRVQVQTALEQAVGAANRMLDQVARLSQAIPSLAPVGQARVMQALAGPEEAATTGPAQSRSSSMAERAATLEAQIAAKEAARIAARAAARAVKAGGRVADQDSGAGPEQSPRRRPGPEAGF